MSIIPTVRFRSLFSDPSPSEKTYFSSGPYDKSWKQLTTIKIYK